MRWTWLVVVAVACGPSNAEIKTARTAVYKASIDQVTSLAIEAAQDSYQIGERADGEFATVPRFYSATGELESAGAENTVMLKPGSVRVIFHVKVSTSTGDFATVAVTPETYQLVDGSPMPRKLAPDDPYLPPFVLGRADSLALAIYERAKAYVAPP
jgi:hypothetical protein